MSGLFAGVSSSLPQHCTPTSSFLTNLSSIFHTCVPTPLALLSTVFGICSIVAWLFAQLPQIFKNFALKSASGLSIIFLIEWLLGDATNLVGSLLTGQASWQVVIAAYYVSVDMTILGQYFWYTYLRPGRIVRLEESKSSSPRGDSDDSVEGLEGLSPSNGPHTAGMTQEVDTENGKGKSQESINRKPQPGRSHQTDLGFCLGEKAMVKALNESTDAAHTTYFAYVPLKNALLTSTLFVVSAEASPLYVAKYSQPVELQAPDARMVIGQITSWICTALYLGSRIPQIYKNQQRRSTSGLSPALFISAFCGNLFYSSSLLANPSAWSSLPPHGHHGWAGPEGSDRATWVRLAAPFFFGAFGVLGLDAIIGVQFLRFGARSKEEKVAVINKDGRGRRGRWQKVSGWMRGWVPSPGPGLKSRGSEGVEEEEGGDDEQRRLLLPSQATGRDARYGAT